MNQTLTLVTIAYANAPEFGAQYATIEANEDGTQSVYVHFNEPQYDGSGKPYKYHAWAAGTHHTAEQVLQAAKDILDKHACRSGYYGPMDYTVTEPTRAESVATEEHADTTSEDQRLLVKPSADGAAPSLPTYPASPSFSTTMNELVQHPAEAIRRDTHTFQQWLQCFADLFEQVYITSYNLDLHDLPILFTPAYEKGQSVADFFNEQFAPDDDREPNGH